MKRRGACIGLAMVIAFTALPLAADGQKDNVDAIGNRKVAHKSIISEQKEIAVGKQYSEQVDRQSKLINDPVVTEYVNRVGQNIARNSDLKIPLTIKVIDDPSINAFALPGGFLYVNTGTIKAADEESQLAGVLAHEMAHVVKKHQLNDIRKNAQKGLALDLAQLRGGGGLAGEAARAFARAGLDVYIRGLSREDELEADAVGVVIATRAGYEPYGLVSVLQTLQTVPQTNPDMALFLKTHPSPADRLTALEAKLPAWFETLAKPNPALMRYNQTFRTVSATK